MHYKYIVYIITRYSNRRLYDPQANRSITLEDLTELIRGGQKVRVVESLNGRDVTGRVLAQALIFDIRRWKDADARIEILKTILREGEGTMDILKKTYLASLGALELTREKAEELIDTLIKKGEIKRGEREDALSELLDKVRDNVVSLKDRISAEVEKKIESLRVARKTDLDALSKKVDSLTESLAKIEEKLNSLGK